MDDKNRTVDSTAVFGRQETLQYLEQRARAIGLTAVTGGPMMGKSATLSELDRRLCSSEDYLVGFYEAKSGEVSHFLYAIANLYERWLADARWRDQAALLWKKNSAQMIPRIGQGFARLLKTFTGKDGSAIAELACATFDGLATLQEELITGGLSLAPLPYDQTRELANLVADITGKRVVLILDGWGNSANPLHERQTLEAFVKHTGDWPRTHVFFGTRTPAAAKDEAGDLTFLRGYEPLAQRHELQPLDLSSEQERQALLRYLKLRVPATADASEEELTELIGGFPGVLSRWITGSSSMTDLAALRRIAADAHAFRYTDLEGALRALLDSKDKNKDARVLCARVAFLPRLNRPSWEGCRAAVLAGIDPTVLDDLVGTVLERHPEDIRIPSFGHETRHAAARHCIVTQQPHLMARLADELIERLASEVPGVPDTNPFPIEMLASRTKVASEVHCSAESQFLVAAAASVARKPEAIAKCRTGVADLQAATQRVPQITSLVAMGLVNRGVNTHDLAAAMADFTTVIELPGVPVYPLKQALYNRARSRMKLKDRDGANADLQVSAKLLDTNKAEPSEVIDFAVAHFAVGQYEKAASYCTEVIENAATTPELRGKTFKHRGSARYQLADNSGAIADFTAALEIEETPLAYKAAALTDRAQAKASTGDSGGSLLDAAARIEFPVGEEPGTGLSVAYQMRAAARIGSGEFDGAIEDLTHAIESAEATDRDRARSLLGRGRLLARRRDSDRALEDFTGVITLGEAAEELLAKAFLARAQVLLERGERNAALADFRVAAQATSDPELSSEAQKMMQSLDEPSRSN
jgi:tetratricopeptide (TPR) repeat protein